MINKSIGVFLIGMLFAPALLAIESNIVGYVTKNGETRTIVTNLPIEKVVVKSRPEMKLHLAERLSYSTTPLEVTTANGVSKGTGFFYAIFDPRNRPGRIPAIFTNRHVMEGALSVGFYMHASDGKGGIGKTIRVEVPSDALILIAHPNPEVDLCCFLIGPMMRKLYAEGVEVVAFEYDKSYIPTEEYLKDVTQLDDVVMIGYPSGLWDWAHNQPIFRRGVLATNPSLDFNGKKEFLIDMPVYWGSSGSPVLLYAEGIHQNRRNGPGLQIGNVVKLLGVTYATECASAKGQLQLMPIPAAVQTNEVDAASSRIVPMPVVRIPNNLGVIIKSSRIIEMETMILEALDLAIKSKNQR